MKYIVTVVICFMLTSTVFSKEIILEMLNKRDDGKKMVYSQDIVKVPVGGTVKWIPKDGGHNVEFVAGPEGFQLPPKSYINRG